MQGFGEKGTHVKIVVPLEIDDGGAALVKPAESLQHRFVVGKGVLPVADPELKEVSQDEEGSGVTLKFRQEA